VRHGATPGVTDPALLLTDDPDLTNIEADPVAWADAHPCECEGLCVCDEDAT
jgi:hypothetical protein